MGILIIIPIILAPLVIWGIVNPQHQWRVTQAWRYRRPEMNEPSDAAYALMRVGNVILLVLMLVMVVLGVAIDNQRDSMPHDVNSCYGTGDYSLPGYGGSDRYGPC